MVVGARPQRRHTRAAPRPMIRARVDDRPVWLAPWDRRGVPPRWDEPCPPPGQGVGWRRGWVPVSWGPPRVSAAPHRVTPVASGAAPRLQTWRGGTGPPVHPREVRDDRWAAVVPGPRADAPVDSPAIPRVRQGLGRRGLWSGGEWPLGALEPRAVRPGGGDESWYPGSARPRRPGPRQGARWAGASLSPLPPTPGVPAGGRPGVPPRRPGRCPRGLWSGTTRRPG